MTLALGTHRAGPGDGSLLIRTYREGVAAKVGHDLVIEVTDWEATIEVAADAAGSAIRLHADPRALVVREGVRGVKPLTDRDRAEILKNIDQKVLHGQPIEFSSTTVRGLDGDGPVVADGELTMAGSTRPVSVQLHAGDDGRVYGTVALTQSDWGIKPYRGLMGALKVRDELEIAIDARLPAG